MYIHLIRMQRFGYHHEWPATQNLSPDHPAMFPVSSDGSKVVGPGEMERGDTRTEFGSAGQSE